MDTGCLELSSLTGLSVEELSELEFIQHTNSVSNGTDTERLYFFSRDSNPTILSKINGLDRFYCLRVRSSQDGAGLTKSSNIG